MFRPLENNQTINALKEKQNDHQESATTPPIKRRTTDVDYHVGGRVRFYREEAKLSRDELGKAVGLGFKQIRKYEIGENRICASMLFHLSKALNIQVSALFHGLPLGSGIDHDNDLDPTLTEGEISDPNDLIMQYYEIDDPKWRQAFLNLVRSIAKTNPAPHHNDS